MKTYGWAWHVHHEVLAEPLTEPIETRRQYIRENKPLAEHAVRLARLKVITGAIPEAVEQPWAVYQQARAAVEQAWAAVEQAWAAYEQARAAYKRLAKTDPNLAALHAQECPDCPWNGETLFPE